MQALVTITYTEPSNWHSGSNISDISIAAALAQTTAQHSTAHAANTHTHKRTAANS